jgi:hypothetical protein
MVEIVQNIKDVSPSHLPDKKESDQSAIKTIIQLGRFYIVLLIHAIYVVATLWQQELRELYI